MDENKNFVGKINREFEEREVMRNALQKGLPYINLSKFIPNIDFLKLIPKEVAIKAQIFPLDKSGKKLKIAIVDDENAATKNEIKNLEKQFIVEKFLGSAPAMSDLFSFYDSIILQKKEIQDQTIFEEKRDQNIINFIEEWQEKTKNKIEEIPVQTTLNEIKIAALQTKTSDIHFEPSNKNENVKLRFRIDGVLHTILELSTETAKKIITRIKHEAGMKSNISDLPQDGHLDFEANGRKVDLRVSIIPTPLCESAVIRILDSKKGTISLESLGFESSLVKKLQKAIKRTNGLILITGPTGSGKTTTLYSLLQEINTEDCKVITLEDPIEYHIPEILQSQVNENRKYNFDEGFKAILRHDPDVILVGEVRTFQTGHLATEASLTGHLVLSTLHTNTATGAISRLRNLGIENFNIAPSLHFILAQRLVRKVRIEETQKVPIPQNEEIQFAFNRLQKLFPEKNLKKTMRVLHTKNKKTIPYEGRMVISEGFFVDENIQKMIYEGRSTYEIEEFLKEKTDFLTLFESGLLAVLEHKTTLDEVYRTVGDKDI